MATDPVREVPCGDCASELPDEVDPLCSPAVATVTVDDHVVYCLAHRRWAEMQEVDAAVFAASLRRLANEVEDSLLDRPTREVLAETEFDVDVNRLVGETPP